MKSERTGENMPSYPLEQRIVQGALHMDTLYPGWLNRVNTTTLDMSNPHRDILAQGGIQSFEPGVEQSPLYNQHVRLHGHEAAVSAAFDADHANGELYLDLTAAWVDYIIDRKETDLRV